MGSRQKKTGYKELVRAPLKLLQFTYEVESNKIIVALACVELDGKTSWISIILI